MKRRTFNLGRHGPRSPRTPCNGRLILAALGLVSMLLVASPAVAATKIANTFTATSATAPVSVNDGTTGTGSNQFEFAGSGWWYRATGQPSYLGDDHYSKKANDFYRVPFNGTQVQIFTAKGPSHGKSAVSIDGGTETIIDHYASSRLNRVLVYTSPTLPAGDHTLKVRITGTKSAGSTDTYVLADRIAVTSGQPEPEQPWVNVVNDQFNSGGVPTHWNLYQFRYSSSDNCASPGHVTVSGGYLRLLMKYETTGSCGAGWYTGGMAISGVAAYASVDQRITVRFRVVNGGVIAHRIIPMRWPVTYNGKASGEEDYCESHDLTFCSTFFHYDPGRINFAHTFDLTQWHTMRFERRNYVVKTYIDDMVTPDWTYYGSPTTLPATLKRAVFQQECQPLRVGGCPVGTAGTEEIQIDWILIDNPA